LRQVADAFAVGTVELAWWFAEDADVAAARLIEAEE